MADDFQWPKPPPPEVTPGWVRGLMGKAFNRLGTGPESEADRYARQLQGQMAGGALPGSDTPHDLNPWLRYGASPLVNFGGEMSGLRVLGPVVGLLNKQFPDD